MSTEAKHTPIPWVARKTSSGQAMISSEVNGNTVAVCYGHSVEAITDAHRITRAVNNHDALVEALRRVQHVPCEMRGNIHCTMLPAGVAPTCPWCEVRAALAGIEKGA